MIHIVIGTRAQLFKMAPVMLECEKRGYNWRWIYTAQHKDTIEQSIKTFGLPQPAYTVVEWDTEAKTISKMWQWVWKMTLALFHGRKILAGYTGKKNIVITHGDSLTTPWAALFGRLYSCRVMHVEAGMRSGHLLSPFPEELNRIITAYLSNYHMANGADAVKNLAGHRGKIINTYHNTQVDTLKFGLNHCESAPLKVPKGEYVVVAIHRYETIFNKERMQKVTELIRKISNEFPVQFVMHPSTEAQLKAMGLMKKLKQMKNVTMLPRLEYLPFIKLIKHCAFAITDSGGGLEELYFMGKPTLVFRMHVERTDFIGKTAILYQYDDNVAKNFIENYKKYEGLPVVPKESPSQIIVNQLEPFGAERI